MVAVIPTDRYNGRIAALNRNIHTMTTLFILGRIIFGAYFAYQGFNHLKNEKMLTGYAKSKGVPSPRLAVVATGIILLLGGLGVATNYQFTQAAALLVIFLVPTTFMMHAFWRITDAGARMNEQIMFFKNIALVGACLMLLGL
jgi:putative oxidoreductase